MAHSLAPLPLTLAFGHDRQHPAPHVHHEVQVLFVELIFQVFVVVSLLFFLLVIVLVFLLAVLLVLLLVFAPVFMLCKHVRHHVQLSTERVAHLLMNCALRTIGCLSLQKQLSLIGLIALVADYF